MDTQTIDVSRLLKDAAGLIVTTGAFGLEKKADMNQIQTDADSDMMRVNKILLNSPEHKAVLKFQAQTVGMVRRNTVPSVLTKGMYLFRASAIEGIENYLCEQETALTGVVEEFCAMYQEQVQEARRLLCGQFREEDYPPTDVVRQRFVMRHSWVTFSIPENIPPKVREAEEAKAAAFWEDAAGEIRETLRAGFGKLVNKMVDRLAVKPGEKPPIFRDSLVENWDEFFTFFEGRDLTNDTDLQALVTKARALLGDADAKTLRNNLKLRNEVATGFGKLAETLDECIEAAPKRKFDFDA